jgi:hypothetical protein
MVQATQNSAGDGFIGCMRPKLVVFIAAAFLFALGWSGDSALDTEAESSGSGAGMLAHAVDEGTSVGPSQSERVKFRPDPNKADAWFRAAVVDEPPAELLLATIIGFAYLATSHTRGSLAERAPLAS